MIQNRSHFPTWLTENGLIGIGVEVGVYFGQYSSEILAKWPGNLVGVDPYVNYPKDEYLDGCNLVNLEEAMSHALGLLNPFGERFKLLRMPSVEAITEFEDDSCDFVYIDSNHDYEHASEDIQAWWPKVMSGGVLGGHDYLYRNDDQQRCDVKGAVDEFSREHPTLRVEMTSCTSWFFHKP